MKPLFFGSSAEPLFGVYTPSRGVLQGRRGAVLCPSIGQEGLVSHRPVRILADRLADAGIDVLRFDYFGTGDSSGDNRAGRPTRWLEDVRLAVDTLRELAGVRHVALIGLRLGGLFAAAAEARAISRLILWDPVLSGSDYLDEARAVANVRQGEWEILGFPLTPSMREDLEQLSLDRLARLPSDIRIVMSQESPAITRLRPALGERCAHVEVAQLDAPPVWIEERVLGLGALPAKVLQQIVGWTK